MTPNTPAKLAGIIVGLALLYFVIDGKNDGPADDDVFLPEFAGQLNEIDELVIRNAESATTLRRVAQQWVAVERDNYPADIGTLRQLVLALSDAKVLETKTSNPLRYAQIGVDDPESADSEATSVQIKALESNFDIILGKVAQTKYRYARRADSEQSVLIDQNPELPDEVSGWLRQAILDISADRVQIVSIEHGDGERIDIAKQNADSSNFEISNMPVGRELSYATVANGIGGALSGLTMDDVRKQSSDAPQADTIATFITHDGLTVVVSSTNIDDEKWLRFAAIGNPAAAIAADENSTDNIDSADEPTESSPSKDVVAESQELTTALAQWEFKIADHKANLFTRRIEDMLKPLETE